MVVIAPPDPRSGGAPASRVTAVAARLDAAALRGSAGRGLAAVAARLDAAALRGPPGRELAAFAARLDAAALRVSAGRGVVLPVHGAFPVAQPRGLERLHFERAQVQVQLLHDRSPG